MRVGEHILSERPEQQKKVAELESEFMCFRWFCSIRLGGPSKVPKGPQVYEWFDDLDSTSRTIVLGWNDGIKFRMTEKYCLLFSLSGT